MLQFFREGGVAMLPILVLGVAGLVAGTRFLVRPERGRSGFFAWLAAAQLAATMVGFVAALGAVFTNVPANPEWAHSPDLPLIVMTGLAESTRPGTLGLGLLTVMCVLVAVGQRRLPREA